ncbi:hypothetical protein [Enterococcus malodoratus]|uniref:hypothetical protein n=1 Tax=Enterococcus malodoratus TaxID=71451 RepID=UPI0022E0EEFD|nr:hypothetical protein [Enterococcus malodoratus]
MTKIMQLKEDGEYKYIKTHADAIDGVDGKLVKAFGNETVAGTKNFQDGVQSKGKNVLTQNGTQTYDHTNATDSVIQSGTIRFIRYGDLVLVNFNFQCRNSQVASGTSIIGSLEADVIPANSIQVDVTLDKALTVDASGKVVALWGLNANSYYAGSAMYFAKNKL